MQVIVELTVTPDIPDFNNVICCRLISALTNDVSSNSYKCLRFFYCFCSEETTHIVLDTERIIVEVEKRPALYNKELKEYSDRNAKEKLWTEVCANVIPKWHELSGAERKDRGKEVQKKWKNLKDCFARELAAQKKIKPGEPAKKRRE
ncbi:uncharacterized protein LOC126733486 [Anthonomus grandis grandis]|uniref:uncharacterized protein LOC126733486 n=1 Tax=Anthonomus grandis grandis TaxID=2921223 RepID=UPI002165D0C5|nr:uncharacterized protein LOC126733486 [Anthonomus grandis grandis]